MPDQKSASDKLRETTQIFSRNLRRLTQEHGSIASVSSRCGVNRQQFNKYLAGENLPSVPILIRICAVFDIGLDDIMSLTSADNMEAMSFGNLMRAAELPLDTISPGSYLEIAPSDVEPGSWLIALSTITRSGKSLRYTRRNRVTNVTRDDTIWSYAGFAHIGRDAAVINYVNTFTRANYGTYYLRRANYFGADLHGIKTAITGHVPGRPFSAPIYLRALGENIDEEKYWPLCRIMPFPELSEEIQSLIEHLNSRIETGKGPVMFSGG